MENMLQLINSKYVYFMKQIKPYCEACSDFQTMPEDVQRLYFYDGQPVLRSGEIYLLPDLRDAEKLEQAVIYPGTILMVFGEGAASFAKNWKKDTVVLALRCSYLFAYNLVDSIFDRYRSWREFYADIRTDRFSWEYALQVMWKSFRKPVYLLTRSGELLAAAEYAGSDFAVNYKKYMEQAIETEKRCNRTRSRICRIFQYGDNRKYYLCEIHTTQKYYGTVVLDVQPEDEDDLATLTMIIARGLSKCLTESQLEPDRSSNSVADLLDKIMNNCLQDEQHLNDAFASLPYPVKRHMQLVLAGIDADSLENGRYLQLAISLQRAFPGTNIGVYNDGVVLLFSYDDQTDVLSREAYDTLDQILTEYSACAAVGMSFIRRKHFNTQYRMISYLLNLGRNTRFRPNERIFEYTKYGVYLIMQLAAKAFTTEYGHHNYAYLTNAAVVRLAKYDEKHHTEYLQLLHIYLMNGMNVSYTAEVCYMHRNTVRNKIAEIQKIVGCSLSDPSVQFSLLLSCYMLRYGEKYLEAPMRNSDAMPVEREPEQNADSRSAP